MLYCGINDAFGNINNNTDHEGSNFHMKIPEQYDNNSKNDYLYWNSSDVNNKVLVPSISNKKLTHRECIELYLNPTNDEKYNNSLKHINNCELCKKHIQQLNLNNPTTNTTNNSSIDYNKLYDTTLTKYNNNNKQFSNDNYNNDNFNNDNYNNDNFNNDNYNNNQQRNNNPILDNYNKFNNNKIEQYQQSQQSQSEIQQYNKSQSEFVNKLNNYLTYEMNENKQLNSKIDNLMNYITINNSNKNVPTDNKNNDYILISIVILIMLLIIDIVLRFK